MSASTVATAAKQEARSKSAAPQRSAPEREGASLRRPGFSHLQHALGNRAMHRLLQPGTVQTKLTVGPPDDDYEREADRVADLVMRMPDASLDLAVHRSSMTVQRFCPECEGRLQHEAARVVGGAPSNINRKCAECEEELHREPVAPSTRASFELHGVAGMHADTMVHAKRLHSASLASSEIDSGALSSMESGGQPLPVSTRSFFERRMGFDFGAVRIHTGERADRLARSVEARAFTHGGHLVFRTGEYAPDTLAGRQLLAHELTHTIQQGASSSMERRSSGHATLPEVDATPGRSSVPAVQRVCQVTSPPADIACPEAVSSTGAGTPILFDVDSSTLSPTALSTLSAIAATWHAGGSVAVLRIDGFASCDGAADLNWRLSCRRAQTVSTELEAPSDGSPGVDNGHIEIFANGETDQFSTTSLAANRRAEITSAGAPAPTEIITSETVETSPGARTRTTIGVGEEVKLTHAPGSATWSTSVGPAPLSSTTGVDVVFTAPDTAPATSNNIVVTAGTATISFDVLAPTSVAQQRVTGTGIKHTVNRSDSGFAALTFLGPDTVNFSKVRWRELDVAGVGTGTYSCNPASGGHCGAGGGGAACPDNPLSNIVVAGKGTQDLPPPDCAYSGHCGGTPPFAPGSVSLSIPYEYKVGTGAFHPITNVPQVHTLAADASTLTTTKAGETGTTTVTAATVALAQCP
jgi:outer membrane protein OmpA-like peptidoglycan-associated protein